MNMQRRFGVLTAIAGAALALGSLTFGGSATATGSTSSRDHDHDHNITKCPAGTTQFNGQIKTGHGSTALFHWAVTQKTVTHDRSVEHDTTPIGTFVTITQIDPTVTGLTANLKGGHGYRVYSPVISGQQMQSPLNGGHNIPELSHWFLCYTITPLVTTTTELVTTTTEEETTTTEEETTTTVEETTTTVEETTTTTVPEAVTTTTVESDTPTTTIAATTTTEIASEGPTTTEIASEGPTTTLLADAGGDLPTTGGGASLPLVLGLAMTLGGVLFTLLARTPRES